MESFAKFCALTLNEVKIVDDVKWDYCPKIEMFVSITLFSENLTEIVCSVSDLFPIDS